MSRGRLSRSSSLCVVRYDYVQDYNGSVTVRVVGCGTVVRHVTMGM